jgi:hypothetical protein
MCCSAPGPDPQVGAAEDEQAAVAQQGLNFSENYFTNTTEPLVAKQSAAATVAEGQQSAIGAIDTQEQQNSQASYDANGAPAAQNYYNMVNQYSSPAQAELDAQGAEGDVANSAMIQQGAMNRNLASRGVSSNSGMAIYNQNLAGQQATASGAAAANQARMAARSLGMSLTAGAANFGQTQASNIGSFGSAASAASQNSYNIAASNVTGAQSAAALPMQGFASAGASYGNIGSTLASSQVGLQNAASQSSAGYGNLAGTLGAAYLKSGGVSGGGVTAASSAAYGPEAANAALDADAGTYAGLNAATDSALAEGGGATADALATYEGGAAGAAYGAAGDAAATDAAAAAATDAAAGAAADDAAVEAVALAF